MFEIIDKDPNPTFIKVIGVGGAEGNAVEHTTRDDSHDRDDEKNEAKPAREEPRPATLVDAVFDGAGRRPHVGGGGSLTQG